MVNANTMAGQATYAGTDITSSGDDSAETTEVIHFSYFTLNLSCNKGRSSSLPEPAYYMWDSLSVPRTCSRDKL